MITSDKILGVAMDMVEVQREIAERSQTAGGVDSKDAELPRACLG